MTPGRRRVLWFIVGTLAVYAMVGVDVVLRARHAYGEAEKATTAKEAYAWYETAATQFSPPDSRWSRLAREKLPLAKEKWKAELKAKHIAFDDSLFE